jgi:YgiT-type zinc finger domain-containing protein
MWTPETEAEWARLTAAALAEMGAWRAAHPRATLGEIEREVDARLAAARAKLLEASAVAGPAGAPMRDAEPPRCPACGTALVVEGERTRRLRTAREQEVVLRRAYARCPACGTGVFPPG